MARTESKSAGGGSQGVKAETISANAGSKHQLSQVMAGGGGIPPIQRTVTYDSNPVDHWITDAELNELSELRKDNVTEIFWAMLGAFLASIAPGIQALPKVGNMTDPIGMADLLVLVVAGVSGAMTLIMGFFWRQRHKGSTSLAEKIRNRRNFKLGTDGDVKA